MKKLLLALLLASSVALAGEPKHWLPKPEVTRFNFANPLPAPTYINSKGVLVDNSGNLILVLSANAAAPQVMNSVLGVNVDSSGSVVVSSSSNITFAGGAGPSYQDVKTIASPGNPASGYIRLYGDSGTGNFTCLTSSGASCVSGGGGGAWSAITNAGGNLTLANAGFTSTFNQTSPVNWTWANTTTAVHLTPQSSPIFNINGTYFNGAASATDSWTLQDVLGTADNGTSTLTFGHSGSSGATGLSIPTGATYQINGTQIACANLSNAAATCSALPTFAQVSAGTNTGALVIGTGGSLGTSGSGTITATAVPLSGVTGAAAAATATETGAGNIFTIAGVETANLTNPIVIQNTNSTNNNTSGALVVNAAGTSTGAIGLTVNCVSGTTNHCMSMRSGSTVTTGVVSGGTENFYVTAAGAAQANSFNTNGTAGYLEIPTGTQTASSANAVRWEAITGNFGAMSENQGVAMVLNTGLGIANNGSTGPTLNKLANLNTGASPATMTIYSTANATAQGVWGTGVEVSGNGTSGNGATRTSGLVGLVTTTATTVGDFAVADTANSGQVLDVGANEAPGKITQGVFTVTNASTGATNNVWMWPHLAGHQTIAFTADWTCGTGGTQTACAAGTIMGSSGTPMTFTLAKITNSVTLECWGVVGQASAVVANTWSILTATNGATNVTATYDMATAATAVAFGAVTDQTSTTTAFAISPTWTLGGTGTKMPFHIKARIEGASASGTVLSPFITSGSNNDLITIYRGAVCTIDY